MTLIDPVNNFKTKSVEEYKYEEFLKILREILPPEIEEGYILLINALDGCLNTRYTFLNAIYSYQETQNEINQLKEKNESIEKNKILPIKEEISRYNEKASLSSLNYKSISFLYDSLSKFVNEQEKNEEKIKQDDTDLTKYDFNFLFEKIKETILTVSSALERLKQLELSGIRLDDVKYIKDEIINKIKTTSLSESEIKIAPDLAIAYLDIRIKGFNISVDLAINILEQFQKGNTSVSRVELDSDLINKFNYSIYMMEAINFKSNGRYLFSPLKTYLLEAEKVYSAYIEGRPIDQSSVDYVLKNSGDYTIKEMVMEINEEKGKEGQSLK